LCCVSIQELKTDGEKKMLDPTWEIIGQLGKGKFATVYKAKMGDKQIAVRPLRPCVVVVLVVLRSLLRVFLCGRCLHLLCSCSVSSVLSLSLSLSLFCLIR
jgi:hypothetical protein